MADLIIMHCNKGSNKEDWETVWHSFKIVQRRRDDALGRMEVVEVARSNWIEVLLKS